MLFKEYTSMKFLLTFSTILLVFTGTLFAQDINQIDAQGNRQGVWKKFYKNTNQLRYEGQFKDGKEIGVFKFYCEECRNNPSVVKEFNDNDGSKVSYYTIKGKLVTEGMIVGKERQGEWLTYHEKSNKVMMRENYLNNTLEGLVTVYYANDVVTETTNYSKGLKQGVSKNYSVNGVLLNEMNYVDDKLQGRAVYYDSNGQMTIEGRYKEGRKDGLWKYYKNGKLALEETYPKPLLKGKKLVKDRN